MPYVYFGFKPRNRGPAKLAVSTSSGDLEPTEPSKIKVYAKAEMSPIWSLMWSVIGLIVAISTYPQFAYTALVTEGLRPKAATTTLPFRKAGLGVPFAKGQHISEEITQILEAQGFQSMQYMGRLVWLKENAEKDDFVHVSKMAGVEDTGGVPARFMNPDSFQAYLTLLSLASRISETFHHLLQAGADEYPSSESVVAKRSKLAHGWKTASEINDTDDTPVVTSSKVEFIKGEAYKLDTEGERIPASMIISTCGSVGISRGNSGAVTNNLESPYSPFIRSGDIAALKSTGTIFKFNQQLALPDPNLIGDILGRYFLHCLGDNMNDQFENLQFIKSGLSSLRLTRLGDELTHFFKCIEIAIMCNSGCVPFFSGSTYEGCVVSGGLDATISINGELISKLPLETLKSEFLLVSDHTSALNKISNQFSGDDIAKVRTARSMVELRKLCLTLSATQDVRDNVIRAAADLDFGNDSWVVNPANLKAAFLLISNLSSIKADIHPIGRLALFSKDAVLVALSCFGEKSCPTWDIPNGVKCSLSKTNPPTPPVQSTKGRNNSGQISDAAWIMVIRYTDLLSAVSEFKQMAATLEYRSTPSAIAKKVGHRIFSRDRMSEFWRELREALRHVNPQARFETEGDVVNKRKEREGDDDQATGGQGGKRVRKLDF